MNLNNLLYLLPDTSEPLCNNDLNLIDEISDAGYMCLDNKNENFTSKYDHLVVWGHISEFFYENKRYLYINTKEHYITYRFQFKTFTTTLNDLTLIKRNNSHFQQVARRIRRFIALYICRSDVINEIQMAYYNQLYTMSTFGLITIPKFHEPDFLENAKLGEIIVQSISPDYVSIKCRYCGEIFEVVEDTENNLCPNCGQMII
jgi:DNA-directed RNA polymerase subunit RPC12/RpoP